jgi:hypothetical protein
MVTAMVENHNTIGQINGYPRSKLFLRLPILTVTSWGNSSGVLMVEWAAAIEHAAVEPAAVRC